MNRLPLGALATEGAGTGISRVGGPYTGRREQAWRTHTRMGYIGIAQFIPLPQLLSLNQMRFERGVRRPHTTTTAIVAFAPRVG